MAENTMQEAIASVEAALAEIKADGAQKIRERIALVDIRRAVEQQAATIGEEHNVDEPLALLALVTAWRTLVGTMANDDMHEAVVDLARRSLAALSHGVTEIKEDDDATNTITNLIKAFSAGDLATPTDELVMRIASTLAQNGAR
jgi:hypothetical protein